MKKLSASIRSALILLFMIPIILDTKTAVNAAAGMLELCVKTVIPSIFPFLLLSGAFFTVSGSFPVSFLEKTTGLPKGAGGYIILGQLCGYPVGAKLLQDAIDHKKIDKANGIRMMYFCNNASPAFIIGILSGLFTSGKIGISMWLIQIITSYILGILLPRQNSTAVDNTHDNHFNMTNLMLGTLKSIGIICGWVICFGIALAYSDPIMKHNHNSILRVLVCGAAELTNGIFALSQIQAPALRFILGSVLLSFGGICVLMQTICVAPDLPVGKYIISRLFHAGISGILASVTVIFLFPVERNLIQNLPLLITAIVIGVLILFFNKKMVAFNERM